MLVITTIPFSGQEQAPTFFWHQRLLYIYSLSALYLAPLSLSLSLHSHSFFFLSLPRPFFFHIYHDQ